MSEIKIQAGQRFLFKDKTWAVIESPSAKMCLYFGNGDSPLTPSQMWITCEEESWDLHVFTNDFLTDSLGHVTFLRAQYDEPGEP